MSHKSASTLPRIPVGISQCLLGEHVRYDGGHKRDTYINGTLAKYFEFVPVCPEVAIGLGVPRPPIRLIRSHHEIRAVGVQDDTLDVTEALHRYGEKQAKNLDYLCGYIFKRASPSCGLHRVKVYTQRGMTATGQGIYTQAFITAQPLIPCEEEGRLADPALRENFIQRVYVLARWRAMLAERLTKGRLVEFHTRHKYMLMAHSPRDYQALGRLIANLSSTGLRQQAQEYISAVMQTLQRIATRKQHANVLEHLMGYVKKQLDSEDKHEVLQLIRGYQRGELPLIVPLTLLKHHFRRHPDAYIEQQYYLTPHPHELMLRNLI